MVLRNFESFGASAIRAIDEIRSTKADPKQRTGNSSKRIESRINAFYRALGLPAISTDGTAFDRFNNGNTFVYEPNDRRLGNILGRLDEREIVFDENIPEDIVNKFLDKNEFNILDSITQGKRTRGVLFPMFASGDFGIFPQSNRVSGAFFSKDNVIDGITYRRPLIELIILLRLKGIGAQDTVTQADVNSNFGALGEEVVDFFSPSNFSFNLITLEIIRELISSVFEIGNFVKDTVLKVNKLRPRLRTVYLDKKRNVAEEQSATKSSDKTGDIEKLKTKQLEEINKNNALLSLVEYDDTITNGAEITKNMKNAIFANLIVSLINSDAENINKQVEEREIEEKRVDQLLRSSQRSMDLLLGTFSGISGIDIIVVMTALFTMSLDSLLGLLDKESIVRLKKLKGVSNLESLGGGISVNTDLFDSVSQLEARITKIFEDIKS